ncbi:MAG: ABC transporter permease subunit [Phycisphaerae bacterium]
MGKTMTIARREVAGYFFSPVGYIVSALFLEATGIYFFARLFIPGQEATLKPLFDWMAYMMVFAAPLLTMRLLSEEYRSGTVETLMTAPVTDTQVILGKYIGVLAFYMVLLMLTCVFLFLMIGFAGPDMGVAAMGYLGLVMLGAAYLSVGLFASTLTKYQLLAFLISVVILAGFAILMHLAVPYVTGTTAELISRMNAMSYFKGFSRGILDTRGVVFFLTWTATFLFLSVKVLESRRWR